MGATVKLIIMIIAKYKSPETIIFANESGERFEMLPGVYCGVLSLLIFVDSSRHVERNTGLTRITYTIEDEFGSRYVYYNLVGYNHFWPDENTQVNPAIDHFASADAGFRRVIDTRDFATIRYRTGEILPSNNKHNDVEMKIRESTVGADVRLTVYVGDLARASEDSYRSVDYSVPIERLLWHSAPLLYEDDVWGEGADYVHFNKIVLPPVVKQQPIPGVTPSPFRKLD